MAVKKHLHTYERHRKRKNLYRCIDPDCTHVTDKDMLQGKRAMCKCGEEFILSRYDLNYLKTPRCENCSNTQDAKKKRESKILFDAIFNEAVETPEVSEISVKEEENASPPNNS